ncbi:MAG: hypothetical protein HY270_22855 [Deltaproteobacteria bacterium]|nr:hypothetical protein [Deltaproteobacteria bacterium]
MSAADREAEERLELMPRSIRDKLDRVGIKLHLKEWQLLSLANREHLRDLPCTAANEVAAYNEVVQQIVRQATGHPPDRLPPK